MATEFKIIEDVPKALARVRAPARAVRVRAPARAVAANFANFRVYGVNTSRGPASRYSSIASPAQAIPSVISPAVAPAGQRGLACVRRTRSKSSSGFQGLLIARVA